MSLRAMIVEDDPPMAEVLIDILDTMQHKADAVADMKAAREHLNQNAYDYAILDMAIPVASGRLADREVGRQLLKEIRSRPETATLPVLVITGHDRGEYDFMRSVQQAGGYDKPLLAFLQKSAFDPDEVCQRITELLASQPGIAPPAIPQKPITVFSAQTRPLTIYRKCVPIKHFRDNATKRLLADRDLVCGRDDIIANEQAKGYYLRDWIKVEVIDADGPCYPEGAGMGAHHGNVDSAPKSETTTPSIPVDAAGSNAVSMLNLTCRQKSILKLVAVSAMTQKEMLSKLDIGKSTLNRDLTPMRDAGLLHTDDENRYSITEAGRTRIE